MRIPSDLLGQPLVFVKLVQFVGIRTLGSKWDVFEVSTAGCPHLVIYSVIGN